MSDSQGRLGLFMQNLGLIVFVPEYLLDRLSNLTLVKKKDKPVKPEGFKSLCISN